ncbi:MAG: PadR family transcriptional regulator PadR, partial [Rhodothermales bacterium]
KRLIAASLQPLMLSLLADGPKYGYQIIQRARNLSDGEISWSNSKLYPLLHRLQHEGLVEAFWETSESGPDRKYYKLTVAGFKVLDHAKLEWKALDSIFVQLWAPKPSLA